MSEVSQSYELHMQTRYVLCVSCLCVMTSPEVTGLTLGLDGMERPPYALGTPKFPSSVSNVQPCSPTLSEQRA